MQLELLNNKLINKENIVENLNKLLTFASVLEECKVNQDGSIYIKFKNDVMLEANGNIIRYTPKTIIDKADIISLNPTIENDIGKQHLKIINRNRGDD